MANENKKPVLRIIYYNFRDFTIFDTIEEALNRANIEVEQFGGGGYFTKNKNSMVNVYSDLYIKNYKDFDIEFCEEIIKSVTDVKTELIVFENDPIFESFI